MLLMLTPEAFWARVLKTPTCWLYNGQADAYGTIQLGRGRTEHASRYAWTVSRGPIPSGLQVLHHCDVPGCVKAEGDETWPDGHLFLGTATDNMQDMAAKGRNAQLRQLYVRPKDSPFQSVPTTEFRLIYGELDRVMDVTVHNRRIGTWIPSGREDEWNKALDRVDPALETK